MSRKYAWLPFLYEHVTKQAAYSCSLFIPHPPTSSACPPPRSKTADTHYLPPLVLLLRGFHLLHPPQCCRPQKHARDVPGLTGDERILLSILIVYVGAGLRDVCLVTLESAL